MTSSLLKGQGICQQCPVGINVHHAWWEANMGSMPQHPYDPTQGPKRLGFQSNTASNLVSFTLSHASCLICPNNKLVGWGAQLQEELHGAALLSVQGQGLPSIQPHEPEMS